jgi:hypothetical protein
MRLDVAAVNATTEAEMGDMGTENPTGNEGGDDGK